jgi:ubiquinone/menaquinone biosynthesis C-methylase UbiE
MGTDPTDIGTEPATFVDRLLESFVATADVFSIYLGYRLGWYDALAKDGPASAEELATRTATNERYALEWLEQQAASGILTVDDARAEARARVYGIPPAVAAALTDREDPSFVAPLAQIFAAMTRQSDKLVDAYRSGKGVSWAEFGDEMRAAQGDQNRVFFLTALARDVFPAIPELHERLQSDPPARVADLACGVGWSSIAIARAYPKLQVDGYDLDAPSIAMATRNLAVTGVEQRVRFEARDAADPSLRGQYDLVLIVEALHDLARPVEVLRTARRLLNASGKVIVIDENTGESFAAPGPFDRLFYGFSLFCCLPDAMSQEPSAATGTVMRPSTLRAYAKAAGFRDVMQVPVDAGFFRVDQLVR